MRASSFIRDWGSTPEDRAGAYACDALLPDPDDVFFRAVAVVAPAATTFRWLCQLRGAPYSYDKIDNLGRRSPQTLTPGLDALEPGQRINTIFRLTSFVPARSLTMQTHSPFFGRVACTYAAVPDGQTRSRLVVKFLVRYPRGPIGWAMRVVLPPGDLMMMRRQLLNLAALAEATGSLP
jgi:hypothetical protein